MLTAPNLRDIAAYLRRQAAGDRAYAGAVMVCSEDAAPLMERAARLDRWADALAAEADTRALATVDLPLPAARPGDDAINS